MDIAVSPLISFGPSGTVDPCGHPVTDHLRGPTLVDCMVLAQTEEVARRVDLIFSLAIVVPGGEFAL